MVSATVLRYLSMTTKQPLVQRIVIAFVLMTFIVGGVFSISIFKIVHYIEEQLVTRELQEELNLIIQQYVEQGMPLAVNSHTRYFSSASGTAIPAQFANLKAGFTEVDDSNEAFYVFKRVVGDVDYMLVEDQTEFESREIALYQAVLAGFLLSLLAAWIVGSAVARKVIAPVLSLAEQVSQHDQLLPQDSLMAAEYANDEVGDLAKAFDHTLGQLRSSLARERLFTSDVSHELRTPLMVIASSCELLLDSGKLTPVQQAQLVRTHRAVQEMTDLIQTFLMLARADKAESQMGGNTTLEETADNQYSRWESAFSAKGIDFVVVNHSTNINRYNATFLNTVMSNLLRNALHYTETGSVRLTLSEEGFAVEDSGLGIPHHQLDSIFQPFVRGEMAQGEGLGLGLSLVKRICQHQGWQVDVRANTPTGTIFSIKLMS